MNVVTSKGSDPAALPPAKAVRLEDEIGFAPGSIVSRTITRARGGTITLFAFDAGQELSEHTSPFDALVTVLDGDAEIAIGGVPVAVGKGETVCMPANVPHALKARRPFKMLLSMVRGDA